MTEISHNQTQHENNRINVEMMKWIMSEKKTALPFRRNQDWKKNSQDRNRKNKRFINNYPITESNDLINAKAKLFCGKIGFLPKNTNKDSKPE